MDLLKKTIEEIKKIDNMYLDKKEVLKRLTDIKKEHKKQLALLRVSNWVACKDKLPEERKTVLVYTSEHGTATAIFTNGNWRVRGLSMMTEVTHWMDRPKPPC